MNYFSTRDKSLKFSFKDIFLRGLAPGGGLFLPSEIKKYNQEEYILKEENVLSEEELINIIKKSQESKKYKMLSILKYNLHVDPKEIVEYKLINYEKFLTEVKEIKDVIFEDTIKCYQNMNIIYVIYSEIEKKNRKKTEKYKLKLNNKKSRKYC